MFLTYFLNKTILTTFVTAIIQLLYSKYTLFLRCRRRYE